VGKGEADLNNQLRMASN